MFWKEYQTLERVFQLISKQFRRSWLKKFVCALFFQPTSRGISDETLVLMFNILHESWKLKFYCQCFKFKMRNKRIAHETVTCFSYRCRLRFDKNASESDVIFVTWTQNVVEKGLALSEQLQWSTNVSLIWFISLYLHMKPVFGPMTSTTATGTPKCDTIVLTKTKKRSYCTCGVHLSTFPWRMSQW